MRWTMKAMWCWKLKSKLFHDHNTCKHIAIVDKSGGSSLWSVEIERIPLNLWTPKECECEWKKAGRLCTTTSGNVVFSFGSPSSTIMWPPSGEPPPISTLGFQRDHDKPIHTQKYTKWFTWDSIRFNSIQFHDLIIDPQNFHQFFTSHNFDLVIIPSLIFKFDIVIYLNDIWLL